MQTRTTYTASGLRVRTHAGFSLVEILIVSSLVGLLAFIAIPNYIRSRANAAKSACINNLRQIDAAVQQWALEQKKTGSTSVNFSDISPYLKYAVVCPAGGTSFTDSYSLATVASEPLCLKVPLSHLFPGSGLDLITGVTGTGNPTGPKPPTLPPTLPPDSGSGSGKGNGSAARPPPRIGPPSLQPGGHPGNGNGNGNGHGNGQGNNPSNDGNGSANGNGNGAAHNGGKGSLDGNLKDHGDPDTTDPSDTH